ncbi:helix-turn-helix domain-containing protein [Tianweitania aestuarii]|uniref:helix-turn-helix domain-containing protein n=1 Tax=Tianweitania aestuarii TaxID=2814886 RepID=UPI003265CCDE
MNTDLPNDNTRDVSDLVWGLDEISHLLGRTRRQTHFLLIGGHIPPARKLGGRWVVSKRALTAFFQNVC